MRRTGIDSRVENRQSRHETLAENPPRATGTASGAGGKYDRRALTYANTFDNRFQATTIRAIEWLTGKITLLRMIRELERRGAPQGSAFWKACLDIMGIDIQTPAEQIANIPAEGPLVVVANHPHGLVDGMVMAELVSRRREDYKILVRALLTGLDEVASSYLISVPFPHDAEAQKKFVAMRAEAMAQLKAGGAVALFPSGVVAASKGLFGPAVEAEWNVFTAQMIRRSGARVVPVYFPGHNSRAYQIANRVSSTLRQGLLLHEIVRSCHRPQAPIIGAPLTEAQMEPLKTDPRGFMKWLRAHTLGLGNQPAQQGQRVGTGASPR